MKKKIKSTPLLMLLSKDIHNLEYNPKAQYQFNRFFAIFWLCNMPFVIVLNIFFSRLWLKVDVMYLIQGSLWALVATHFGAMSSALSIQTSGEVADKVNENVQQINKDINEIDDEVDNLTDNFHRSPQPDVL